MDRFAEILKFISKTDKGIEIAPWFAPIAPKKGGFNCVVLDLFDRDKLLARAEIDPNIPKDALSSIEAVDLVGSAVEIAELVNAKDELGSFDYIISSHNFEHLPNPIRFLQNCQKVLKPGGILSMAIPDLRACFDHFRPPTILSEWLEAYFEARMKPSFTQIFSQRSYSAELKLPPGRETAFLLEDNPAEIWPNENLREVYADWLTAKESGSANYTDTHCSTFTMSSFELLIAECRFLGLIDFTIKDIAGLNGCEFFVHLENCSKVPIIGQSDSQFYHRRAELFHHVANELAQASAWGWSMIHQPATGGKTPDRMIVNNDTKYVVTKSQMNEIEKNLADLTHSVKLIQSSIIWRIGILLRRNRLVLYCNDFFKNLKRAP